MRMWSHLLYSLRTLRKCLKFNSWSARDSWIPRLKGESFFFFLILKDKKENFNIFRDLQANLVVFWSHWMGGSMPSIFALDDSGSAGHWQVKVKHKHWHFLEGRTPGTQSSRLSSLQLLSNNKEMIPQPKHSASGKIRKACFPGVDPVITHVTSIVLETLQVGDLAGSPLWTVQLVWVLESGVLVKSGRRREALASPILAGSPQPCLLVYFVKQPWFLSSAAEVVHPWRGWGQASPFLSGLLTQLLADPVLLRD